jgi:FixJ family two-component response regulator
VKPAAILGFAMPQEAPLIAIVDDEEPIRRAFGRLLRSVGMRVETFRTGGEFLAALDGHWPDCVVLDLHMPEMTGFELLERVTALKLGLPLIAITGHDMAESEERALRGGAAAYLRKPINQTLLIETIARVIAEAANQGTGEHKAR